MNLLEHLEREGYDPVAFDPLCLVCGRPITLEEDTMVVRFVGLAVEHYHAGCPVPPPPCHECCGRGYTSLEMTRSSVFQTDLEVTHYPKLDVCTRCGGSGVEAA